MPNSVCLAGAVGTDDAQNLASVTLKCTSLATRTAP
jgi:hypothetical protein